MGFEPTTSWSRTKRATKLRYISTWRKRWDSNPRALADDCISSAARYSHFDTLPKNKPYARHRVSMQLEQVKGIEPSYSAWKADVLPLNYTCEKSQNYDITKTSRCQ